MCRPPLSTLLTSQHAQGGDKEKLSLDPTTWVTVSAYKGLVILQILSSKYGSEWKNVQKVSVNREEFEWMMRTEKPGLGAYGRVKVSKSKGGVSIQRTDNPYQKFNAALPDESKRLVHLTGVSFSALWKSRQAIFDTIDKFDDTVAKTQRYAKVMTDPEFSRKVIVACAHQVYKVLHASTCDMCFGMETNACTSASKRQWLPTVHQALRSVTPPMIGAVYASNGIDHVGKDFLSATDGHRDEMIEAISSETVDESARLFFMNHYHSQQYIVPAIQQKP